MAISPGDINCNSGLSKRIWDNMVQYAGAGKITGEPALSETKAFCFSIAKACVDEINSSLEIETSISLSIPRTPHQEIITGIGKPKL